MADVTAEELRRLRQLSPSTADAAVAQAKRQDGKAPQSQFWGFDPARRQVLVDPAAAPAGVMTALGRIQQPTAPEGPEGTPAAPGSVQARLEPREDGKVEVEPESFYEMLYMDEAADLVKEYGPKIIDDIRDSLPELPDATSFGLIEGIRQVRSALRLDKLPSWMTMSIPEMGGALDVALSEQFGRDPGPLGRAYQGQRPDIQTFTGAMVQDTAQMLPGAAVTAPFGGWVAQSVNRVRKMPLVSQLLGSTVTFSGAEALSFDPFDTENYGTTAEDLTMAGDLLSIYESGDRSNPRWREAEASMEQPIIRLFGEARNMLPAPAQEALTYLVRNPEDGEAMRRFKMAAGGLVDTATEAMFLGVVESGKAIKQFGQAAGPEALDAMIRLGDAARERNAARRADGSVTLNSGADPQQAFDFMAENLGDMAQAAKDARDVPVAEPYYSALNRAVGDFQQKKATPDQWRGMITKLQQQGVKPDEVDYSGVMEWLGQQDGPVTKGDLLAYLDAENNIRVTQTEYIETMEPDEDLAMEDINDSSGLDMEEQEPDGPWLSQEANFRMDDMRDEAQSDFDQLIEDEDLDPDTDFEEWFNENYYDRAEQEARDSYYEDTDNVIYKGEMEVGEFTYEVYGSRGSGFSIRRDGPGGQASWDSNADDPDDVRYEIYDDYQEAFHYTERAQSRPDDVDKLSTSDAQEDGAQYGYGYEESGHNLVLEGGDAYREITFSLDNPRFGDGFSDMHFGPADTFAHARTTDRRAPDGMRYMMVEEVQSDLHRKGAEHGYRTRQEARQMGVNRREAQFLRSDVEQALAEIVETRLTTDLDIETVNASVYSTGGSDAVQNTIGRLQRGAKPSLTVNNALRRRREKDGKEGHIYDLYGDLSDADIDDLAMQYEMDVDQALSNDLKSIGDRRDKHVADIAKHEADLTELPEGTGDANIDYRRANLQRFIENARNRVTQMDAEMTVIAHIRDRFDGTDGMIRDAVEKAYRGELLDFQAQSTRSMAPDFPFKSQWPEFVMRRLMRAVAEGKHADRRPYDALVLSPAQVHKDRYNLSKWVDEIDYRTQGGQTELVGYDSRGEETFRKSFPTAELKDAVGKDVAKKIQTGVDDHSPQFTPEMGEDLYETVSLLDEIDSANTTLFRRYMLDQGYGARYNAQNFDEFKARTTELEKEVAEITATYTDNLARGLDVQEPQTLIWKQQTLEEFQGVVDAIEGSPDYSPLSDTDKALLAEHRDALRADSRASGAWASRNTRRNGEYRTLGNLSLDMGATWPDGLYTNKIPRALQKYLKQQKLDGKLELMTGKDLGIPTAEYQNTKFMVLKMGDDFKRRLKNRGQPLWGVGGAVGLTAVATGQAPDEAPREPQDQERSAILGLLHPALVPEGSAL